VVVTAAAHTVSLADGISEAEYECEGGDANEQSHSRQRIGTAQCFLSDHREFLREPHSEQGSKKRTCAHSVENPAQIGCVKIE